MTEIFVYRENGLDDAEYRRLDEHAADYFLLEEHDVYDLEWGTDEYGDAIQKHVNQRTRPRIWLKVDAVTPHLMESLLRPCNAKVIARHLWVLSCHKPWGRGPETWATVVADLCHDLASVSEYAIIKACEFFRKKADTTFFPNTAALVQRACELDYALRHPKRLKPATRKPVPKIDGTKEGNTPKQCHRISLCVKIGLMQPELRTTWQKRWFDAFMRRYQL